MNPELRQCSTCPIKSAQLTEYKNRAGLSLSLCAPCLQRRNIVQYRPKFVAERIKSRELVDKIK